MGALLLWLGGAIAATLHTLIEYRLGLNPNTTGTMRDAPVLFWTTTVLAVVLWPLSLAFMLAVADTKRSEKP